MAGTIKGIVVEIGGDTSGLQKALSKVNSSTSSLSKELRGINSLLKLDPKNTELLSQKQEVLSKNIQETSEKLKLLKQTQEQADEAIANGTKISDENYRNLQREIINTENKLNNFKAQASNWSRVSQSLEAISDKFSNISKKLDTLGSNLTTTLTLPVLAVGTAAVTTGNSFEAQMSRVQAIAGATGDELDKLTEQAMQLGSETSFSATQVAEGMENLASAGFTTEEIMEAMPGLLDLAASSGADLATSSEIAASAIRGFGLEASSAGHVADVFAEAAARTNAQTEDMGEAMKYIAPVANTMGLKIEEVAAAIGIMSDAGIKGSQAGTSLRGALTRLTKPTDKMLGVMDDLGISFYDNEGKMKSLTEIIGMLQDATKDLTDEQEQNALTTLFGTESLSGMVALINRGSDDLSDLTKSFEKCDGSASDMADTMLDNTAGALESLSGSLETAGIAIQKALAPEIKKLAKWIQGLVDDFSNLSDEQQLNILKIVGLVAAIGPAVKIISKLSGGISTVTKGLGTVSTAIGVFRTGTESANTSANKLANTFKFFSSPAGITTTAITAVTAALTILKSKIEEEMSSIKEANTELQNNVQIRQSTLDSINDTLNSNLAEINNTKQLRNELSRLVDENGKVKKGYKARVNVIINELNKALGTEYALNGDLIESYDELKDSIDELIEKKKAQIILEANEEKYKEAIKNKDKTMQDYLETQKQIAEVQQKINDLDNDWGWRGAGDMALRIKEYNQQLEELQGTLANQDQQLKDYNNAILQYQQNSELMLEGGAENYKKIEQSVSQAQANITASANAGLTERINNQIAANAKTKELYDLETKYNKDAKNSIYATNVKEGQKNLQALADELVSKTKTIGELGQDEIDAWKALATNSYDVYSKEISKMPKEMRDKIEKVTGVVANDKTVKVATTGLAKDANSGFNNNVDASKWGHDLVTNLANSLSGRTSKSLISGAASTVAGWVSEYLHHTTPEKGPMKNDDKWMYDFIDNLSEGIYRNKNKLLKQVENLAQSLKDKLVFDSEIKLKNLKSIESMTSAKVINTSRTVFTTPQIIFNVNELDEAKLQQCFNYINRKFGSQY